MSVLFLLFVGMNKNVRAAINSAKVIQKSTDKDQSEKESQEHEPEESIDQLDFFGAFSLVNVQLQWRDLESGLSDEEAEAESSINQKELYLEHLEQTSSDEVQVVSNSLAIITGNDVLPIGVFRTIDGKTHFLCNQNKQSESTIAYILNCGTYPKSC